MELGVEHCHLVSNSAEFEYFLEHGDSCSKEFKFRSLPYRQMISCRSFSRITSSHPDSDTDMETYPGVGQTSEGSLDISSRVVRVLRQSPKLW